MLPQFLQLCGVFKELSIGGPVMRSLYRDIRQLPYFYNNLYYPKILNRFFSVDNNVFFTNVSIVNWAMGRGIRKNS